MTLKTITSIIFYKATYTKIDNFLAIHSHARHLLA